MDAISGVPPVDVNSTFSQQENFSPSEDIGGPRDIAGGEDASLGDKFFQILSETKREINEKTSEIQSTLKVDELTPMDLIRLQYEIAEITIQQELISKGVSKSTQNVDTLLKAQ
ncbi:type III secretion system inner rod subunit SctI [Marinibactrum halimedae]|uniref:EscI/YscI/HrpB family type III secretion system inner rod protein n=1 Tax=Marinibactrum halimedae TaxID=1444977 RepID=A0AA37WKA0_9GAMM|nr:type III secretion system inner rod subunit SctI [Marinibactrum halimedae]MCD9459092.1 type III secretion system inner rod subunit SctI [Marinibactrum halimedae]GLS24693.1 hypothetical protein GCM10007877_04070 [Marinibactrum halimedae]